MASITCQFQLLKMKAKIDTDRNRTQKILSHLARSIHITGLTGTWGRLHFFYYLCRGTSVSQWYELERILLGNIIRNENSQKESKIHQHDINPIIRNCLKQLKADKSIGIMGKAKSCSNSFMFPYLIPFPHRC